MGQFNETVRLTGPDQTTVLRKGQVRFELRDADHHATNVTVLPQVEFATAGTYYLEVLVDDVMKLRFPLSVVVVTPPPNPGKAPGVSPSPPPKSE